MPKNNSIQALPALMNQLLFEHEQYLKKTQDLTSQIEAYENHIEKQSKIILSALSEEGIDNEKLATLKPEFKNLVKDYVNIRSKLKDLNNQISGLKEDIKKVDNFIRHYGEVELDEGISEDVSGLAGTIHEFIKERVQNSVDDLMGRVRRNLEGERDAVPPELESLINEMVIERLESLVEPYELMAYKLTHNEITQEEFIDTLKKKALVEQMRSKLIADITHAINQRDMAGVTIPPELKKAIDNLITDRINYVLLTQQKDNLHNMGL